MSDVEEAPPTAPSVVPGFSGVAGPIVGSISSIPPPPDGGAPATPGMVLGAVAPGSRAVEGERGGEREIWVDVEGGWRVEVEQKS